jgi:hypothetical protein
MTAWFIVSALVTLDEPNTTQQVLRIPTHDDNIRNHHANLLAQGFRVVDVKILPWYQEAVDEMYEADATPTLVELTTDEAITHARRLDAEEGTDDAV